MSPHARPQPLLAVRDVQRSSRWYATLLEGERTSELMESDHAHVYDRILSNGQLVCNCMPGTSRITRTS